MMPECFHNEDSYKTICVIPKVCLVLCLVIMFLLVVHPLLTALVIPPISIHKGAEYFLSGEYINYESGSEFAEYITSFDFTSEERVVDFYHVDNWTRDNLINGKHSDIFSMDIVFGETEYDAFKSQVEQSGEYYKTGEMEDFELWQMEDTPNIYAVALCDDKRTVRCILIADSDSSADIRPGLSRYTDLKWAKE